jgi:DMSO/TMAO reductase YedYZ molybdopterin-dependent catalytic subunit
MTTTRRKFLFATTGATGAAGLIPPDYSGPYGAGETLTYAAHRLLGRDALAREFPRSEISNPPFANGRPPQTDEFRAHQSKNFADWRLTVEGLVSKPLTLTVEDVRKNFASRSQITHLACEEGWSYIAEWIGAPLSLILEAAGAQSQAKYVVYHSIQKQRWDSMDMDEARHPQTLVTYGMNGGELPVGHGAPLRMRVPRQLGYKSIKYLNRITLTDDITKFGKGRGSGATEAGYAWFAGI